MMKKLTAVLSVLLLMSATFVARAQSGVVVVPLGGDTYQAGVAKTGQTTCYVSPGVPISCSDPGGVGQDGELQKGVVWPDPRFTDKGDGTVRDNLTGLIWLKNADCPGTLSPISGGKLTREKALNFISTLNQNLLLSDCGDKNHNDDWRLPNRFELESLLDLGEVGPSLPSGYPFTNVRLDYYWTSSYQSYFVALGVGWAVHFSAGDVEARSWALEPSYVWPVRDEN